MNDSELGTKGDLREEAAVRLQRFFRRKLGIGEGEQIRMLRRMGHKRMSKVFQKEDEKKTSTMDHQAITPPRLWLFGAPSSPVLQTRDPSFLPILTHMITGRESKYCLGA